MLKEKERKKEGFTYHKLQFSLYVCPVKNLFPFLSQVPERRRKRGNLIHLGFDVGKQQ